MDGEYILNRGAPWTLGLALVFILSKHDFGLQSWKSPLTLGYVCKVLVLILMLKMQWFIETYMHNASVYSLVELFSQLKTG